MTLDRSIADALRATTTGTIHTVLLKKGIRRTWMRGPRPLFSAGERVVGPAFTLRFVPVREDLATPESWSSPRSTRGAIEDMPEGCIAVGDAMGVTDAGIFGDILCARMHKRGVTALITDGVMRDGVGVASTGLPVWCAGIAVFPDDIVVADGDGAIVIPKALVEEVAKAGPEQERLEAWIMRQVEKGVPLPGLYPPNAETKARYEAETRKG